jgi:hypothetical protein
MMALVLPRFQPTWALRPERLPSCYPSFKDYLGSTGKFAKCLLKGKEGGKEERRDRGRKGGGRAGRVAQVLECLSDVLS